MQHIFMDESGSLGFTPGGTAYFIMAFAAPKVGKELSKCIKNFNAHLIRNGWNKNVETKASNLWHASKDSQIPNTYAYKNDPSVPMRRILEDIGKVDGHFEYACVKLDTISDGLKTAPNCILYNYFAWQLLQAALCSMQDIELFVDRRNREYHNLLKFDGYIEGKTGIERAKKLRPPLNMHIHHLHWNSASECKTEDRPLTEFGVRGLEAVDFICWAIKKKYENGDNQWFSLVEKRLRKKQHLYF
jgi:hypothetical protein